MLIPTCKAYKTLYWLCVMTLAGSQTNGYSRWAIPSVAAELAQPTCTIRQISQAMKLIGSRSTRAAISPGMTRVVGAPTAPVPEVSCVICVLLTQGSPAPGPGRGTRREGVTNSTKPTLEMGQIHEGTAALTELLNAPGIMST